MKKPRYRARLNAEIREQATEWFVAFCEEEVDAEAREEFNDWLRASPEHVRAYLRICAFWEDGDLLTKNSKIDIGAVVQRATTESNIVPLPPNSSAPIAPERTGHWRFTLAASFFILCLSVALSVWFQLRSEPTYTTATGEERTITLADGSIVELNARSRVRIHFTDTQRVVDLLEGQALFRVAKNRARPFIVRSDTATIKAVGTQFDVYRKVAGTVVTVVEGQVAVDIPYVLRTPGPGTELASSSAGETLFVNAGEQVTVTENGPPRPKRTDLAIATAWTEGKLVFDATPLSEVVQEFNRYNTRRLVIDDPELRNFHISGVFPSTDPTRIIEFLRQRFAVIVRVTDDQTRITRR